MDRQNNCHDIGLHQRYCTASNPATHLSPSGGCTRPREPNQTLSRPERLESVLLATILFVHRFVAYANVSSNKKLRLARYDPGAGRSNVKTDHAKYPEDL